MERKAWGGGGGHDVRLACWTAAFQGLPVQLQARPKVSLSDRTWVRPDRGWKKDRRGRKSAPAFGESMIPSREISFSILPY